MARATGCHKGHQGHLAPRLAPRLDEVGRWREVWSRSPLGIATKAKSAGPCTSMGDERAVQFAAEPTRWSRANLVFGLGNIHRASGRKRVRTFRPWMGGLVESDEISH
jgi:hypothetical protein